MHDRCWLLATFNYMSNLFYRSSTRNRLDRVTLKQHRLPPLTERLKIHSKPQTYHPSLDSTLPRTFLPRRRRLWHQIDPMTTKVGDARLAHGLTSSQCLLIEDFNSTENEKDADSRSGPATQGMIQRRRRPKRRSTGVVHVDMEVNKLKNESRRF